MSENIVLERKCDIEEVLDLSFIELLRLVPRNPHVRALILKFTGKMPGADCETFEQLKDWVEVNCEKLIRKAGVLSDGSISINVSFSEIEYGRASYSVNCHGTGAYRFTSDELVEIIQEAIADGGAIDEVVDVIARKIDSNAWNECSPDMDDYGDYDYSDHDSNNSDSREIEFSKNDIRSAVLRFVQQRHPELAAEL